MENIENIDKKILEFPKRRKLNFLDLGIRFCQLGLVVSIISLAITSPELMNFGKAINIFSPNASAGININNVNYISEFGGNIAMIDNDNLRITNLGGIIDYNYQIVYANPVMVNSDNRILVYDKGGYSYSIYSSHAKLYEQTMESPILNANINDDGVYIIINDESGYRGGVTAYNKNFSQIYKWATSDYYIMDAVIKNNNLYVSTFFQKAEILSTKILHFDLARESITNELILDGELGVDIEFIGNDKMTLVTNKNMHLIDKRLKISKSQVIPPNTLSFKHFSNGVLYASNENTNEIKISTLGSRVQSFIIDGRLKSISINDNYIAILTNSEVFIYNEESLLNRQLVKANDLVITKQGTTYLLYNDLIDVLPKKGE